MIIQRIGLIAGVLLGAISAFGLNAGEWRPFPVTNSGHGVFEPSGVRQLQDGRILIVQDEPYAAFSVLTLAADGQFTAGRPLSITGIVAPSLNDLEGLARGPDGNFYAMTSFSRTRNGNLPKSRQRFARLRPEGDTLESLAVYPDLLDDILQAYPWLIDSTTAKYAKGRKALNIEGLCFDKSGNTLLIGLRGPILGGDTLILTLENPAEVFDGVKPRFAAQMTRLNLNKAGIRAISYIPAIDAYLLIAQKANRKSASNRAFQLWVWSGLDQDAPRQLDVPNTDLRQAEGITQIDHMEAAHILLVSDDGDRRKRIPAHYLILTVAEIAALMVAD